MVGKHRFPEYLYHDPVRREFAGEMEIISAAEILARYRATAEGRIDEYVRLVLAPAFPDATRSLVETARALIALTPHVPDEKGARANLASRIADGWSRIVPLRGTDRRRVEAGLANHVLMPKRFREKRRRWAK